MCVQPSLHNTKLLYVFLKKTSLKNSYNGIEQPEHIKWNHEIYNHLLCNSATNTFCRIFFYLWMRRLGQLFKILPIHIYSKQELFAFGFKKACPPCIQNVKWCDILGLYNLFFEKVQLKKKSVSFEFVYSILKMPGNCAAQFFFNVNSVIIIVMHLHILPICLR